MKKRLVLLILLFLVAVLSGVSVFQIVFEVPDKPSLIVQHESEWSEIKQCYRSTETSPLDKNGDINILIWNIYKQNRINALDKLALYAENSQLLLLQEASLNDELKQWIESQHWDSSLVRAFDAFDASAGVLSLSSTVPELACAYTETEPLLRLPKSALYTLYPLSNGEKLAVINVHAINFTLGTNSYLKQLNALKSAVANHKGPLILAGDFNTWSESRTVELEKITAELHLKEVVYLPDNRKTFITGLTLDHVYYKNLVLINAKAPVTDASDHNPIRVKFRLNKTQALK